MREDVPAEATRPIRVLLVDGNQSFADDIVSDFGRNGAVVTVAHTLADARASLRQRSGAVDVVILEICLPDGRGESLLPDIETLSRQPAVIITSTGLPELDADALAYRPLVFPKPIATAALLRVVRTVVAGYTQPMISRFVRRFRLSRRETEAVVLLARGLCVKEIAPRMKCSEKMVYAHLATVCKKAGCRGYHALVGRLLAFACQTMGHTPPDHVAFADHLRGQRVIAGRDLADA